jgi:hypothetical protein
MVNDLDKKATAAGEANSYKFGQPFSRAGFENGDLDKLRNEARALTNDRAALSKKAQPVIDAYRSKAKAAAQQGEPLPPLPVQLHQLENERVAISVNHMRTLQTALGSDKTAQLEAYLAREVTPRVKLKALAHPPADRAAVLINPQTGTFVIP